MEACENRKFGHGCNITCGHCLNQDYCHQGNGACPSGCKPGYGGDLCKTRNEIPKDFYFVSCLLASFFSIFVMVLVEWA